MVELGLPVDPQPAVLVRPGNVDAAITGLPQVLAAARSVRPSRATGPHVVLAPTRP